jgi:hypothetical protein
MVGLYDCALDLVQLFVLGSAAFVKHVGQIPARHVRVNATDPITARLQFVARLADFHTFSEDGAKGEAVRLLVRMLDRSIVPRAWQAVVLLDAASLLQGEYDLCSTLAMLTESRLRRRTVDHNRRRVRAPSVPTKHLHPSRTWGRDRLPASSRSDHDERERTRRGDRGAAVVGRGEAGVSEVFGEMYGGKDVSSGLGEMYSRSCCNSCRCFCLFSEPGQSPDPCQPGAGWHPIF